MARTHRVTLVAALSLVGCSEDSATPTPWQARLEPIATCADAKAYVRDVALQKMNREIDEQIARFKSGAMCPSRGWGSPETDSAGDTNPSPPSEPSGPTTGTGTNNQVQGVDEADFVKNDGQYIYLAQNGVLRIVDAWPADQTHEVAKVTLPGKPRKLFVDGDRALVYVAMGVPGQADTGWQRAECTYGYDCDFTGDGTQTKLVEFDITNRAAPAVIRQVDLAGSLIAARRVGSAVHTVVTLASAPFPELARQPDNLDLCAYGGGKPPLSWQIAGVTALEAQRQKNAESIAAVDLDLRLDGIRDSAAAPDADPMETACAALFAAPQQDGTAFTSIVSLDLATPATPATVATVISRAGAVYADADSLYMAVSHDYAGEQRSTVHKFAISGEPHATHYIGSGTVPGRALNQFAMDEHDNFLRIATTKGHAPSPDAISRLTVLGEDAGELVEVGAVDGIAPSEDIRSVRFDGTRAFIVTFKKTDPLFAFDLTNPHDPQKLGELKIPGFSTYMHMLDETHLLTIGYDADDHGSFAYFDGVMLQIFDVSDMTAPVLAHKHVIGTRGSSSEALTNHLAFTWYPEYGLLSIPMTICEGGDDGKYGTTMTFSGLMLFDASVTSGFGEHGRVSHAASANISCNNWWTDAESVVRRSLFLDQYVYSISDSQLKVRDVNALATPLVDLSL